MAKTYWMLYSKKRRRFVHRMLYATKQEAKAYRDIGYDNALLQLNDKRWMRRARKSWIKDYKATVNKHLDQEPVEVQIIKVV